MCIAFHIHRPRQHSQATFSPGPPQSPTCLRRIPGLMDRSSLKSHLGVLPLSFAFLLISSMTVRANSQGPVPEKDTKIVFIEIGNQERKVQVERTQEGGEFKIRVKTTLGGKSDLLPVIGVRPHAPSVTDFIIQTGPQLGVNVDPDGNWFASCQIGNADFPPKEGDTFDLTLALIPKIIWLTLEDQSTPTFNRARDELSRRMPDFEIPQLVCNDLVVSMAPTSVQRLILFLTGGFLGAVLASFIANIITGGLLLSRILDKTPTSNRKKGPKEIDEERNA